MITNLPHVAPYWAKVIWRKFIESPPQIGCDAGIFMPDQWRQALEAGIATMDQGNLPLAGSQFEAALETPRLHPQLLGITYYFIALAQLRTGKVDEAQLSSALARSHMPNSATCALMNGIANLALRQWEAAIQQLEASIRLDADCVDAQVALSILYAIEWQHESARQAATYALSKGRDPNLLVSLAYWQSAFWLEGTWQPQAGLMDFGPAQDFPAMLAQLPDVQHYFTSPHFDATRAVLYISADAKYFKDYAIALALSMLEKSHTAAVGVHFHVMDPDSETTQILEKLVKLAPTLVVKLTTEQAPIAQMQWPMIYYSSARYIRLYETMRADTPRPYVIMDADMLFNGDIDILLAELGSHDAALGICVYEPAWQRVSAACNIFNHTPGGLALLENAAWIIGMNILNNGGRWFIDQIALYLAMQREANQTSVHALSGHIFLNIHYDADAIIWSITNDKRTPDSVYSKRRLALLAAYGLD